ncbi:hypothetical protein V7O66_10685 [Methanolobus sp. ZRKC3]|uniref:hypothetical protein n=1 Tax=Methanolobus sp. ZRKC3 TaxID=3125786 RepID=UPI0032563DDB
MKHHLVASILIILLISMNCVSAESHETTYDYYFGMYTLNQDTIEKYGTLPALETEEQNENWQSSLMDLSDATKDDIASQYMYPNGEVLTVGSSSEGYLVVLFQNATVEKQLMDEIYTSIDSAAKDMNIQDVPVEFGYGLYLPYTFRQGVSEEYMKNGEDLRIRDVENIDTALAIYGEMPEWNDLDEYYVWYNEIQGVTDEVAKSVFDENGISQKQWITSLGISFSGKMYVSIYKDLTPEEKNSVILEIYEVYEQEAEKKNINNPPVVFIEDDYMLPEEIAELEASDDEQLVDEESTVETETEEEPANAAPGFSALTLIGAISLILLFRSE